MKVRDAGAYSILCDETKDFTSKNIFTDSKIYSQQSSNPRALNFLDLHGRFRCQETNRLPYSELFSLGANISE